MPLNDFDEVAYIQAVGNANYAERNGNFVFGVVVANAGVDILWSNGTFVEGVAAGAIDKINPSTNADYFGKVVRVTGPVSPELTGIVVRIYTRQPAGTGTESAAYALVQLLNTGGFIEALLTQLEVVTGR